MKLEMDYSVSKAIQNLKPTLSHSNFPRITATPSRNIVFPGLGHVIRKTNFVVHLSGQHNAHEVVPHKEKA